MNESTLRAALQSARTLEPTEAELAKVLRPRRRRWPFAPLLAAVLVVGGTTAYATGSLEDWVHGRAVAPGENVPAWLGQTGTRVVAENDGVKLYAKREANGNVSFGLNDSVGLSSSVEDLNKQFVGQAIQFLGTSSYRLNRPLDDHGRRPIFGLTARQVVKVRLSYEQGEPLTAAVDGGFVLLADSGRKLDALTAYDAAGRVLQRKDLSFVELRVCRDVRGCPPGRWEGGENVRPAP